MDQNFASPSYRLLGVPITKRMACACLEVLEAKNSQPESQWSLCPSLLSELSLQGAIIYFPGPLNT